MAESNDRLIELFNPDTSVAHRIQGLRRIGLSQSQLTSTLGINSEELRSWSHGDLWLKVSDPKLERLDDLRNLVRYFLEQEDPLSPEDIMTLLQQPIYDDSPLTLGTASRTGETLLEIIPTDPVEAFARTEYYLNFGSLALKNS